MRKLIKSISVFLVILFSISSVNAATLTDKLKDGHKLRLGFGTAVPWAYAGDNGEALGFVNMIALTVLEEMGITEHETKVFEWSAWLRQNRQVWPPNEDDGRRYARPRAN